MYSTSCQLFVDMIKFVLGIRTNISKSNMIYYSTLENEIPVVSIYKLQSRSNDEMSPTFKAKDMMKSIGEKLVCSCQAAGAGVVSRLRGRWPPSSRHLHSSKQIPALVHTGTPGVTAV